MVLYHAGLSIMYNLSYDISPDSSPSQFHLNLMPFLSPLCLERGHCASPQRYVFVVSGGCTLHVAVSMVRALPLAAHVSISLLSSSFFSHFPPRDRTIELQRWTAKDQTPPFSTVSRSQLLMYKMKQCYKPNKNVLPLDSPAVNI